MTYHYKVGRGGAGCWSGKPSSLDWDVLAAVKVLKKINKNKKRFRITIVCFFHIRFNIILRLL